MLQSGWFPVVFWFLSLLVLHSHEQLYIHICMQKHNDAITTSGHRSLEKYTSHFIRKLESVTKGFTVWEVSWRLNRTATYWPHQLLWLLQYFFPVHLGCSTGGLGPSLCWDMVLIPASSIQFNSTPRQSRLPPDIFDRMHLLFTQVHFLFWQLGRVGGQYATLVPFTNPLEIVPSAPITNDITATFMFHSFLLHWQGIDSYLSFSFLLFLLCDLPEWSSPLFSRFSFLFFVVCLFVFCFFVLFCFVFAFFFFFFFCYL